MLSVMFNIPLSPLVYSLADLFLEDAYNPKASHFHLYLPKEVVMKVVSRLDWSSRTQFQKPAVRSIVENTFAQANSGIKLSKMGSW